VYKCFALFIRHVLPITTNTIQVFIHKFMEKGNSQQSNNLKKNSEGTAQIGAGI
jgi:hypothetical protein